MVQVGSVVAEKKKDLDQFCITGRKSPMQSAATKTPTPRGKTPESLSCRVSRQSREGTRKQLYVSFQRLPTPKKAEPENVMQKAKSTVMSLKKKLREQGAQ